MKTNKKVLIYLGCIILIFVFFFYLLLRPSIETKAIREIETCATTDVAKSVWYKYRSDLADDEDFCQVLRDKLTFFNLKSAEISEIKKSLPPKTENLNVIIVPDLSKRIRDEEN